MVIQGQTAVPPEVAANKSFTKAWTVYNNGKMSWPKDTKLLSCGPPKFQITASNIGEVAPGTIVDIVVNVTAPAKPGSYRQDFQLYGMKRSFGENLTIAFTVPAERPLTEQEKIAGNQRKLQALRAANKVPPDKEKHLLEIMNMHAWDPEIILELLTKYKNDPDLTVTELLAG